MFHLILRLCSFSMFTFLRIAVAVTNNAYSMMMDVFSIIDDVIRNNIAFPDPDSISNANRNSIRQITFTNPVRPNSRLSHTSTQTEECFKVVSNDREKGSNTDIFIYNLDASKKLVITHKNIDSNSIMKSEQCKSSNQSKYSRTKSFICDSFSQSHVETEYSSSSQYSSSNMSLENDVSETQILQFSCLTKAEEGNDRSLRSIEENQHRNGDNSLNSKIDDCDEFEIDLPEKELLETKQENITGIQKTSSPIKMSTFSFIDPCNKFENYSIKRKRCEVKDIATKTSDESSISEEEETATNFETMILLDDSARRRLSLPASFNTSIKAADFDAIKNEIAETIKNTSRHEKSMREIKYPLSESFLTKDNGESKEVLSCSSYESLPLSEHLHNAFEKSTFFSIYRENFISTSTPDFSSVDEFVEAFNKMKSTLSVSELVKNKNTALFSSCTDSKREVKFKRAHSYEILETKNSQENCFITPSKVSNNKYTAEDIQSKHSINDDVLAIKPDEKKLNSSIHSVDLICPERLSSSSSETNVDSCKNCLISSDEDSEDILQLIKSKFDKISDGEDNIVSVHERYDIYDDQIKLDCESNFIKTMNDCSFQPSSTKPLKFERNLNLKQSESSEISGNNKETNSQVPNKICVKQTATELQKGETIEKRYEIENTEKILDLHTETSKCLFPKVMTDTEKVIKICENSEEFYQSFASVRKRGNEFIIAKESDKMQIGEDDHESITIKKDKTICRNDSLGHDIFVSFVEENSFYDTNLEDSTLTSEQLACK